MRINGTQWDALRLNTTRKDPMGPKGTKWDSVTSSVCPSGSWTYTNTSPLPASNVSTVKRAGCSTTFPCGSSPAHSTAQPSPPLSPCQDLPAHH